MDYERIEKRNHPPGSGGGLSPRKLRTMLLGVEEKKKKKQQDQEFESTCSLRSQVSEIDNSGGCDTEDCKDVNVVSIQMECTSTAADPLIADAVSDHKLKGDRAPQRVPLTSFSKPAPSKWDDAQKWIASPTSNRTKSGYTQGQVGLRKMSNFVYESRQPLTKVVVEVPDQRLVPFEEPDTKRIDCSQPNHKICRKFVNLEADAYLAPYSYGTEVALFESCAADSAINLSCHDSSAPIQSETTFFPPPSTARSVSMRDMGTEMTPIASQEPSRNGTPVRATTPTRSPSTSRPSTPQRTTMSATSPVGPPVNTTDLNKELSEKELQMKTRREIMVLGAQLGKANIAAWASKGDEDKDASATLKAVGAEQPPPKSFAETRAAAWEEAEMAKYAARFKREEMKIEAWENHQKAKAEAQMRKTEVEVERMRGRAHDRLMNKLAAVKHRAEDKRAAAEAKRIRQAAKAENQAECIRETGRLPPSFLCCGWCR